MKKLMKAALVLVLLTTTCACSSKQPKTNEQPTTVQSVFIDKNKIESIMADDNYVILDVRTKEEYKELHIKDSMNIPYDEINDKTLKVKKDKIILVYCRSGHRASIALETLKDLGYEAYNMGGIDSIDLPKE